MGKGKLADVGQETWNQNGYCSVKTSTGWRFKHHIEAEAKLGRPLKDNERVVFGPKGKTCFDHDNLIIVEKKVQVSQTYDKRLTTIEDKVMLFIEEAPDRNRALKDLGELLERASQAYG